VDDIISHILVQLTITSLTHAREMQILHHISRAIRSLPFSQRASEFDPQATICGKNGQTEPTPQTSFAACRINRLGKPENLATRFAKQRSCAKCN
jgi:hypothetical protein